MANRREHGPLAAHVERFPFDLSAAMHAMSFARAARRFADQNARHRADAFSGTVADGTADADGNNLMIDSTRFRGAFGRLITEIELRSHGRSLRCNASFMLRAELKIEVTENTLVTHLPTGHVYEVVRIGEESPIAVEKRVMLFRQEN